MSDDPASAATKTATPLEDTQWQGYAPSTGLFYLGVYLYDKRVKPTKDAKQLAQAYARAIVNETGPIPVKIAREIARKFEVSIDEEILDEKDKVQATEFRSLSKQINSRVRVMKPCRELKLRLLKFMSDCGDGKEFLQQLTHILGSQREPLDFESALMILEILSREGKFHTFVVTALHKSLNEQHDRVHRTTIQCGIAVAKFYSNQYGEAARLFSQLSHSDLREEEISKFITMQEVVVIGTVCALAELPRATLNSKFMNNFSSFLDIVPCTRVAISSFCHGNYQEMTQALNKLKPFQKESFHCRSKLTKMLRHIRQRVFVDFFESYTAIKLADIATKIGGTVDSVKSMAIGLIKARKLPARIDAVNMVMERFEKDEEAKLLEDTVEDGFRYHDTVRQLLIQTSLRSNKIRVKRRGDNAYAASPQ